MSIHTLGLISWSLINILLLYHLHLVSINWRYFYFLHPLLQSSLMRMQELSLVEWEYEGTEFDSGIKEISRCTVPLFPLGNMWVDDQLTRFELHFSQWKGRFCLCWPKWNKISNYELATNPEMPYTILISISHSKHQMVVQYFTVNIHCGAFFPFAFQL